MRSVIKATREAEGFLTPGAIDECKKMNPANLQESELAKAQQAFLLVGHRTSRMQAWQQYSTLVAKEANCETAGADMGVALAVEEFRPSFMLRDSKKDERDYQILVLKEHACGEILLGLTEEIFRFSQKAGKISTTGGAKAFQGPLPPSCTAQVVVRLLALYNPDKDKRVFVTTSMHRRLSLQPHATDKHSPSILYQLPAKHFLAQETAHCLMVKLSSEALQGMAKAAGFDTSVPGIDGAKPAGLALCFAYDSFQPNKVSWQNSLTFRIRFRRLGIRMGFGRFQWSRIEFAISHSGWTPEGGPVYGGDEADLRTNNHQILGGRQRPRTRSRGQSMSQAAARPHSATF